MWDILVSARVGCFTWDAVRGRLGISAAMRAAEPLCLGGSAQRRPIRFMGLFGLIGALHPNGLFGLFMLVHPKGLFGLFMLVSPFGLFGLIGFVHPNGLRGSDIP